MSDSKNQNAAVPIIFLTMSFAIGYAILRYHILGDVPWKDFPFFILNKGLSLPVNTPFHPALYRIIV